MMIRIVLVLLVSLGFLQGCLDDDSIPDNCQKFQWDFTAVYETAVKSGTATSPIDPRTSDNACPRNFQYGELLRCTISNLRCLEQEDTPTPGDRA